MTITAKKEKWIIAGDDISMECGWNYSLENIFLEFPEHDYYSRNILNSLGWRHLIRGFIGLDILDLESKIGNAFITTYQGNDAVLTHLNEKPMVLLKSQSEKYPIKYFTGESAIKRKLECETLSHFLSECVLGLEKEGEILCAIHDFLFGKENRIKQLGFYNIRMEEISFHLGKKNPVRIISSQIDKIIRDDNHSPNDVSYLIKNRIEHPNAF